jgi:hypothetical protein
MEDHSEGPRQQQRKPIRQGMRIITIGLGTEKGGLFL